MIWEQINEDRKNLKVTHYENAFPEAKDDINFTTIEYHTWKKLIKN